MSSEPREFVIPAGHGRMWRMRKGEHVTIAQTEGQQVGDLVAFNAADHGLPHDMIEVWCRSPGL